MKVLLDLNVVLDVVLKRSPWIAESSAVWNAHHSGTVEAWIAATAVTNLFYIVRRLAGESTGRAAVHTLLAAIPVLPVDQTILEDADRLPGRDFEDNVCIAAARAGGLDLIVTRDPSGFAHSPIPAVSPAELLVQIGSGAP